MEATLVLIKGILASAGMGFGATIGGLVVASLAAVLFAGLALGAKKFKAYAAKTPNKIDDAAAEIFEEAVEKAEAKIDRKLDKDHPIKPAKD